MMFSRPGCLWAQPAVVPVTRGIGRLDRLAEMKSISRPAPAKSTISTASRLDLRIFPEYSLALLRPASCHALLVRSRQRQLGCTAFPHSLSRLPERAVHRSLWPRVNPTGRSATEAPYSWKLSLDEVIP